MKIQMLRKTKQTRLMLLSNYAVCGKKFLLIGDKFMPELHLKQPGFIYSTFIPFTKNCERIQKNIETGNLKHLHKNKLDQACFARDTVYSDSKYLAERTNLDNILENTAYKIAGHCGYDGYHRALVSIV